jgi:hypothetical protein
MLPISAAAWLPGCSKQPAQDPASQALNKWRGSAYRQARERAAAAKAGDQLRQFLNPTAVIPLQGGRQKSVNRLTVDKTGRLFAVDFTSKTVFTYGPDGTLTGEVAHIGGKVGEYTWPSDVSLLADGGVAVAYSQADDCFYLFGTRWTDGKKNFASPLRAHCYNMDGQFVTSMLPLPGGSLPDMSNYDVMAVDKTSAHGTWAAFPFEYAVYSLDPAGKPRKLPWLVPTQDFKAPTENPRPTSSSKEMADMYKNWEASWTPIEALVVTGKHILIQRQTFSPLRYTVDVWSTSEKRLLAQHATNYLLLGKGADDCVYCLDNFDATDQPGYRIIRAELGANYV